VVEKEEDEAGVENLRVIRTPAKKRKREGIGGDESGDEGVQHDDQDNAKDDAKDTDKEGGGDDVGSSGEVGEQEGQGLEEHRSDSNGTVGNNGVTRDVAKENKKDNLKG
jgi:hypothetical protein